MINVTLVRTITIAWTDFEVEPLDLIEVGRANGIQFDPAIDDLRDTCQDILTMVPAGELIAGLRLTNEDGELESEDDELTDYDIEEA